MKFQIPALGVSYFKSLQYFGDSSASVQYLSALQYAELDCLTFYSGEDLQTVESIRAGILIVDESLRNSTPAINSRALVYSPHPKLTFIETIAEFFDDSFSDEREKEVDSARISRSCHIEKGAQIGRGAVIYPNATVFACVELGEECVVQSGTVLGGSGLGDVRHDQTYTRFVHLGGVKVGSGVRFGANNTVPRGMLEDTVIGSGSRIGNNVNIGHSSRIGQNVYVSSGVTVGGACVIEDNCWIAPGVTLTDHVTVGRSTMVGAGGVLVKDALKDSFYLGNPARKISERK